MSSFERQITHSGKKRASYSFDLFKKGSIDDLIGALEEYKAFIRSQTELFLSRLADAGIRAAEHNCGKYAGMIEFSKEIKKDGLSEVCFLIARDKQKVISRWRYRGAPGGWKEAEVSPLWMAEFGSGWLAKVEFPVMQGVVGQGTFPNQKHAFDEDGWSWTDETGTHHSRGEEPTSPMLKAINQMKEEVGRIAEGVFW